MILSLGILSQLIYKCHSQIPEKLTHDEFDKWMGIKGLANILENCGYLEKDDENLLSISEDVVNVQALKALRAKLSQGGRSRAKKASREGGRFAAKSLPSKEPQIDNQTHPKPAIAGVQLVIAGELPNSPVNLEPSKDDSWWENSAQKVSTEDPPVRSFRVLRQNTEDKYKIHKTKDMSFAQDLSKRPLSALDPSPIPSSNPKIVSRPVEPTLFPEVGNDTENKTIEAREASKRSRKASPRTTIDQEFIQDLWNTYRHPKMPACKVLTEKRKKAIQKRGKLFPNPEDWQTAVINLAQWDFATGKNDRGWIADFDYFLSEKGVRFFEGTYAKPEKFKPGDSRQYGEWDIDYSQYERFKHLK